MLFSSLTFVWFFLPALALIYYLMPGRKLKNAILLIASLIFYTWGEPRYVVLVLLSILVNYVFGLVIAGLDRGPGVKASDEKGPGEMKPDRKRLGRKKLALAVCVIANICLLGYFKYFNFFLELVYTIAGKDGFTPRNIPLPIGISFYTFQAISYIADIYRGVKPVQKNMFRLALYISLFPQILSGPIVRYNELEPQITGRRESISMHAYGIKRFVCGLAKKMIFANMFGQVVDRIWELPLEQLGTAWCGLQSLYTVSRFIMIFPVTRIWPLDWGVCLALPIRKILISPTCPPLSVSSGGGGIYPYPPGLSSISTFPWEATARALIGPASICLWCSLQRDCGMEPA